MVDAADGDRLKLPLANGWGRLEDPLVDVHAGFLRLERPHGDARFAREQRPGRLLHEKRRGAGVRRVRQLRSLGRHLRPPVPNRRRPRVSHRRRRVSRLFPPPHLRHHAVALEVKVRPHRRLPRRLLRARRGELARRPVRLGGGDVASVFLNLRPRLQRIRRDLFLQLFQGDSLTGQPVQRGDGALADDLESGVDVLAVLPGEDVVDAPAKLAPAHVHELGVQHRPAASHGIRSPVALRRPVQLRAPDLLHVHVRHLVPDVVQTAELVADVDPPRPVIAKRHLPQPRLAPLSLRYRHRHVEVAENLELTPVLVASLHHQVARSFIERDGALALDALPLALLRLPLRQRVAVRHLAHLHVEFPPGVHLAPIFDSLRVDRGVEAVAERCGGVGILRAALREHAIRALVVIVEGATLETRGFVRDVRGEIGENLGGGRELRALLRHLPREHVLVLAHVAEHRPLVALPRLSRDFRSVRRDSLFARGLRGRPRGRHGRHPKLRARGGRAPGRRSRPRRLAAAAKRVEVDALRRLERRDERRGPRRGRRGGGPAGHRADRPHGLQRLNIRAGPRRVRGQGLDGLRLRRLHQRVPRLLGPPDEDLAARRGAPARRGRRGRRVNLLHGAARRTTARLVPRLQRRCCVRFPIWFPFRRV